MSQPHPDTGPSAWPAGAGNGPEGSVPPRYGPDAAPPPFAPAPPPPPTAWPVPSQPLKPSALPVTPHEYHEFFRAPRFRWWKPILSLGMFLGLCLLAAIVIPGIAIGFDLAAGRITMDDLTSGDPSRIVKAVTTPLGFAANNIALALAIPFAGLTGWAVYGQRPRWISSITGGFRWPLLWRFALVALPIFVLSVGVDMALGGVPEFRWNPDSVFLILVVLLTTPFQAAGEEYGVRGMVARSIGSWFGSRRLGLVVAAVLSSLLFMQLHGADNVWLNVYYFSVGMLCSVLVWRTGGLEAAVALHVCNNLVGEITLPFGGLEGMFDRGPTSAGPGILFQLGFTVAVTAGMLWIARRQRLVRAAAPAARLPEELSGQSAVEWNSSHTTLDKGVR